jgi:hypothetical protein
VHGPGGHDGRSRTLTDADVDTLAWRVLAKASVLLKHLEKATLSLLLELMVHVVDLSGRPRRTLQ